MKFNVPGKALYSRLTAVSKVINAKNALSILDNFLIDVKDNVLTVTGSDSENVLSASVEVFDAEGDLRIALPAKRLLEVVKEIANQPLTFDLEESTGKVTLRYSNGEFAFMSIDAAEYPLSGAVADTAQSLSVPASVVVSGLERTLFAVSSDQIRPMMTGVYWDIHEEDLTMVSSDTHKLVRYVNTTFRPGRALSFIMPAKPAGILKGLIEDRDSDVKIDVDGLSARFVFEGYEMRCRFIKGNYPNYNRVIPKENPFRMTIDRAALQMGVRRVSLFASKASGLVRLAIEPECVRLASQDLDYATRANEEVPCEYTGNPMVIGFNAEYMQEVLSNLPGDQVVVELADPARPGLFIPAEQSEGEHIVMLQMPMQVIE